MLPQTRKSTVPTSAQNAIRFILDGEVVSVTDSAPTTTLLEFLRERLGRTGTKEGCAEGDCGACTVVLGELDGERIVYRAVNSCIRFVPTVDGKELITVESLKAADGTLHPVQQAMVDCHASQCGFCTPGFVMSLFALYLDETTPNRKSVARAIAGNLCRCTGYRPIIDAGLRMRTYPEPPAWSRGNAQHDARRNALRAIQRKNTLTLSVGRGYHAPVSADELARLVQKNPDALLLAGGTDVGLWVTKQLRDLPTLIYVGDVADLKYVRETGGALEFGAAASLTDAFSAIVRHYPMLEEMADRFGSPPVRNSGTLCGNMANGSPIGDSMPFLVALGSTVRLRRGDRRRELPLEALYLGYQKKALERGEFVEAAKVPLPKLGRLFASYKVSKRIDQDISAICGAFALDIEDGRISAARIAYGGMAATVQRAPCTEAALTGKPWTRQSISAGLAALSQDYSPISDMRASREYRLQVARNLLDRFYLEHASETAVPTRVAHV
jgi:xanthine dehydrogenase small subunit